MSNKSEVVPLGIIFKNENTTDGMVDILTHIHSYVPTKSGHNNYLDGASGETINIPFADVHPILIGGDQLTAARVRGAKKAKINSVESTNRLEGLIPVAEDWHVRLNFIEVVWKYFLSFASSGDHGTLYQLRNRLNRINVVTDPSKNFNACEDFFLTVVSGHIIAAYNELSEDFNISQDVWMMTVEERRQIMGRITSEIVDKFVKFSFHGLKRKSSDGVQNYGCEIMSLGCFYMEYVDCIREGDKKRMLRCWRYLLPIFWNSGRTNYANEVLMMLYQHDYALSPLHAAQLLNSRFINVHGRPGKNVPADLHMEHLNRVVKDAIRAMGPNKKEACIDRVGKALGTLAPILNNFDDDNNVPSVNGGHKRASTEGDGQIVANELLKSKTFKFCENRHHDYFPHPRNVLHGREKKLLTEWMSKKLVKYYKYDD